MRFVERKNAIKPSIFSDTNTLSEIEKLANDCKHEIIDTIYKATYTDSEGKIQSRVRDELNKDYHSKCAYCETFCTAEIEHYRPKKGVVGLAKSHNGYYWLAYEWTNLLPSCTYCNARGGKGIHFTIKDESKRISKPEFDKNNLLDKTKCIANKSPLIDEEPYLLHPEIDNPKSYLGFEINSKKEGIDIIDIDTKKEDKSKGSETIRITNLNREYLRLSRLQECTINFKEKINLIFKLRNTNLLKTDNDLADALIIAFEEIEESTKNEKCQHTLLSWFTLASFDNFKNIVCPLFSDNNQQKIILEAFNRYKKIKTPNRISL